jgi:hypothetical protein
VSIQPLKLYRQSTLRGFTICPRRTMHALIAGPDSTRGWVGRTGDLGRAFHEFQFRYLTTLKGSDDQQLSTQEAIEIMYEILAEAPFTLPFEQMDDLRWLVLGYCDIKWDPRMLKGAELEKEIHADVACPDGEVRVFKGTPDVLMFDPPDGLLIIDAKSSKGKPAGPKVAPEPGEVVEARKYLSDLFQGDGYSYLGMRKYPSVQRVTFREYHLRSGQIRQGTLTREDLEHVERKLRVVMMNLDRALGEGEGSPLWEPKPGKHCAKQCPVARSCPIPEEQRGEGGIGSQETADSVARLYAVAKAQYTQSAAQLKAWQEAGNAAGRVSESEEVRWGPEPDAWSRKGNGRGFGLHAAVGLVDGENEERAA